MGGTGPPTEPTGVGVGEGVMVGVKVGVGVFVGVGVKVGVGSKTGVGVKGRKGVKVGVADAGAAVAAGEFVAPVALQARPNTTTANSKNISAITLADISKWRKAKNCFAFIIHPQSIEHSRGRSGSQSKSWRRRRRERGGR